MPNDMLPDLAVILTFLRQGLGWSQTRLCEAANMKRSLLNDYERGRRPLTRRRLEHILVFMNLPPEVVDANLDRLAANRAAARPLPDGTGRRIETVAARAGRLASELARSMLRMLAAEGEALQERTRALELWKTLASRQADERLALVEESPKLRSWALVELVAAKSIEAAPNSPAESLELSQLARHIAERCPGEETLRRRSEGYAWFHVANSRRATNDLRGSDAALATAARLWAEGAPGDPGFFDETMVFWITATIRKEQRRFSEARRRIEEALAADKRGLRGKLLLTKAQILGELGDIDASTEALREALPCVDAEKEPRTALGILCEYLRNLCWRGQALEALPGLRQAQALAERLGQEIDLLRVDYLSGIVAAGTGQIEEAEERFERVRRRFANHNPPLPLYCALVSLDLAQLLLEQGRTSEVAILANQMRWIFRSQDIHREDLAALRIFYAAALSETATVALARKVLRSLLKIGEETESP
jgi:transcriptional regulator with XRE-family HTH domain